MFGLYIWKSDLCIQSALTTKYWNSCQSDNCRCLAAPRLLQKHVKMRCFCAFTALSESNLIFSIIKSNTVETMPYVYVIVLNIWNLGMSPLFLTFSQGTGREHVQVANCHLFSQAGACLALLSLNFINHYIWGICSTYGSDHTLILLLLKCIHEKRKADLLINIGAGFPYCSPMRCHTSDDLQLDFVCLHQWCVFWL